MAFITLSGTLLDPNGDLAVGDQIRFTHKSTTGETLESAVSIITINPAGTYSLPLQYGLVLVEYKDVRTQQFKNLGVATVNSTNPATSIPELLNALVPVSSAELIEFQAILADCVTAQTAAENAATTAEAFAYQLTTTDLIASTATFTANTNIPTSGFTTSGDGGNGSWKQNGVTGQTPSQTPAQLGGALLNDGNGNQWALIFSSEINVSSLGAFDDLTDDTPTIVAGFSALSAIGGGNLKVDINTKLRVLSNFDIPQNCGLIGDHVYLDVTDRDAWPSFGSRIKLDATKTIGMGNGAKIKGMLIYRDGMTFPVAGLTAAEVALYSGTAIEVKSASPYLGYNTFLGFNLAMTTAATNTPRGRVEFNNADCTGGFKVDLDLGAWTFSYNFLQPILSNSDVDNIRTGIGFDVKNKSDWTTFVGNFTFQDTGYKVTDSNQIKFIGCGADHPTDGTDLFHTGVGFEMKGGCTDNFLIGCQSASHKSGMQIDTSDNTRNYISDCHMWNMASNGFGCEILGGDVSISGGSVRGFTGGGGKGVFVNNANSKVSVTSGMVFNGIAVAIDTPLFEEVLTSQDLVFDGIATVRSGEVIKQIASAGNVTPRANDSIQEITGTTTIGTFIGAGVMPQKIITFIIVNGLRLNHGNTLLNGGVNWVVSAGSSITLQYITGNTWREVSRNEQ